MDLAIEDAAAWSEAIFGSVALGDKRLTRRLIQIGKQLSSIPGGSLSESCEGQDALIEGSYRFLRNKRGVLALPQIRGHFNQPQSTLTLNL
ncbi:hypothetical protein BE843_00505 [Legionella pneumophila subsp. pneumophila]|nr:hypothetical protein BE843_00505 [Legionella pneumophila subsp. pneumophila]AOW60227.1 hypothetical protein BE844_03185 [Legionella pneumophila subsp. pneumophila]AOW65625.1 hypothetical protein BE846_00950 [Legionella pneumophila subsp. pneumophila]